MVTRPDCTPAEHDPVAELPRERFGRPAPLDVDGTELQLDPDGDSASSCPPFYWQARGVKFAGCASGRRLMRPGHGLR